MSLRNMFNAFQQRQINNNLNPIQAEWPEPEPLRTSLLQVEPLSSDMIPKPFRDWISDVAERMQCPVDFISVATIVVTGSIIGTSCGIKPKQKDDWLVLPNLWGGLVGRPGMLKTPAVSEVIQIISQLERDAKKSYDAAMSSYLTDLEVYKSERDAIKAALLSAHKQGLKNKTVSKSFDTHSIKEQLARQKEPQKPIWKRYKANDATVEKLSELLADNPRGLLLYRDELVGLLSSWDKEGRETDRAFSLKRRMVTDR